MSDASAELDKDGFQRVSSSRKASTSAGRKRGRKGNSAPISLEQQLQSKRDLLRRSGYDSRCARLAIDAGPSLQLKSCTQCICLGLGSLSNSAKPLLQLALLEALLEELALNLPVTMIDPVFDNQDKNFFAEKGYRTLEGSSHILCLTSRTFLYMPHCPRSLYEEILQLNSKNLDQIVLLGNDISLYAEREIQAKQLAQFPHIVSQSHKFKKLELGTFEDRPDAFNDMAWQWIDGNS